MSRLKLFLGIDAPDGLPRSRPAPPGTRADGDIETLPRAVAYAGEE